MATYNQINQVTEAFSQNAVTNMVTYNQINQVIEAFSQNAVQTWRHTIRSIRSQRHPFRMLHIHGNTPSDQSGHSQTKLENGIKMTTHNQINQITEAFSQNTVQTWQR